MRTLLIPTDFQDAHAHAVALVLQAMGHRPVLWHCADLPELAAASLTLGSDDAPTTVLNGPGLPGDFDLHGVDVFWHRRVNLPRVTTAVPSSDRQIAERETLQMLRGLLAQVSQRSWAVNGFEAAHRAENKLNQLRAARALGLAIPDTLVSNEPSRIRRFLAHHAADGVVCKNFSPMGWLTGDGLAMNYTSRITADMLPRDGILRLAPAIYQVAVPKAFEVRITAMGAELVAAALHSQAQPLTQTDWRRARYQRLDVQPLAVPDAVAARCQALMARLDLRFGCFDFIVTPDGQWVFLEVNQMGQFLWVEQVQPAIPLLQMFCDFIVSRDDHWRWRPGTAPVHRLADVADQVDAQLQAARALHPLPERGAHVYEDEDPAARHASPARAAAAA